MMRRLPLALVVAMSPLAYAGDPPAADTDLPMVRLGIEHSHPLALPAGAKAGAAAKPKIAHVEEDETRIPVHMHVSADGRSRIECRGVHGDAGTERNAQERAR